VTACADEAHRFGVLIETKGVAAFDAVDAEVSVVDPQRASFLETPGSESSR
jgi:hypothetical protein